jgi:hypothetical protein
MDKLKLRKLEYETRITEATRLAVTAPGSGHGKASSLKVF